MGSEMERFYERCREIHDLQEAQMLLDWDQQVVMPRRGAEQRSNQQGALAGVIHAKITDPALGELIEALEKEAALDEHQRADLREARRARDRAVKIPARLVTERTQACALAQVAWQEAKAKDDYPSFKPHLDRVLGLTREMAQHLGGANPYDALIDEFEPGMTEVELKAIFAPVRDQLVTLLDKIQGAPRKPSPEVLHRTYPAHAQEALGRRVMEDMGYDLAAGRLDRSAHPFTTGTVGDVRITTRYDENFLSMALFGTIHETGHALYEQGLDPHRFRDPAGGFCSMGIHESQSRFWENMVGRSKPFWAHYYPILRDTFPGVLDDVMPEEFYRAINVVTPSLIRVEADEVTYNLHIILRFELESAMISGALGVEDLPAAWNEKMQAFFGIRPPTDREGVLQDIHWSTGAIGYFPTYALGNLYAAQFAGKMREELPDVDEQVARGELKAIKAWLNENIHRRGRLFLPQDLCRVVTGEALNAKHSIDYLKGKYAEVYGF